MRRSIAGIVLGIVILGLSVMLSLSIGSASWFTAAFAGDWRGWAAIATFVIGIATTVTSLFSVMSAVRDRRSSRRWSAIDEVDRVSRDHR